jgi:hypothetical protein
VRRTHVWVFVDCLSVLLYAGMYALAWCMHALTERESLSVSHCSGFVVSRPLGWWADGRLARSHAD